MDGPTRPTAVLAGTGRRARTCASEDIAPTRSFADATRIVSGGWIPAVPDLPGSRPDAMAFNTAYFSAPLVGRQAEEYPRR
jgi:hypothetical protein